MRLWIITALLVGVAGVSITAATATTRVEVEAEQTLQACLDRVELQRRQMSPRSFDYDTELAKCYRVEESETSTSTEVTRRETVVAEPVYVTPTTTTQPLISTTTEKSMPEIVMSTTTEEVIVQPIETFSDSPFDNPEPEQEFTIEEVEALVNDADVLNQCIQDVYAGFEAGTLDLPYTESLQNCYIGTAYEQFVPESPDVNHKTALTFPKVEDVFESKGAQLDVQAAYDSIERDLTIEESQNISDCFVALSENYDLAAGPSSEVQLEIAKCYEGTSYAPIAEVYKKIALRVDCANDSLGEGRVFSIVKNQDFKGKELAIVEKCIIERSAKVGASLAVVNAVAGLGGGNSMALLYFLISQPFVLLMARRKKAQWGTVYNSYSRRPVDLSIVRLLKKTSVFRTRVTDGNGRYLFFAEPGNYGLEARKSGFTFPSLLLKGLKSKFMKVSASQGVINDDIPIDPIVKDKTAGQLKVRRARLSTHHFVAALSPIVVTTAAVLDPKAWMIILALLSIALFVFVKNRIIGAKPTTFGHVKDAAGKPIKNAVVRLFTKEFSKLVDSGLTDRSGRFAFLVGEGTYFFTVEHKGKKKQSGVTKIKPGEDGWIASDIVV